jgi:hypothetical protein
MIPASVQTAASPQTRRRGLTLVAAVSAQYRMVVVNGKLPPPLVAFPVTVIEPWAGMTNEPGVGSEQPNGGQLLGPTSTVSRRVCSWLPALSLAE